MGNSGSPHRLQVAPSSPSSPTRLVSAMPSSRCWPSGRSRQCRIGLGVVGEPVHPLARRPHADLVHPAAQVRRRRDVRREGDDALGGVGGGAGEVEQGAAERGLGGGVSAGGAADVGGQLGHGVWRDGRAAQAFGGLAAQRCGGRGGGEPRPWLFGRRADLLGELAHLLGREQRGVVLRVAFGGQAVALDGVGEDHRRTGVVDGVERLAQRGEVVAAEVADGRVQGGVVEARPPARRAWDRPRAAVRAAGPGCSGAAAGTRGSPSRRSAAAARRRRGVRTARAAGART